MLIMADGILVGDLADVPPLAFRQQVAQSLIVDLNVRGMQLILPTLLLQHLCLLQNLATQQQDTLLLPRLSFEKLECVVHGQAM